MEHISAPPVSSSSSSISQCPVPHASNSPLPPGHPPTSSNLPASNLQPPPDPRCVFFRTDTDPDFTPPISRQASFSGASALDLKAAANINPLPSGKEVADLNPDTTLVLASRNSQLALVQSSQVSAMLHANYGRFSPSFPNESDQVSLGGIAIPPPTTTNDFQSKIKPVPLSEYQEEVLSHFRSRAVSIGLVTSSKESPGIGPLSFPITSMSTVGDNNQKSPLYVIGGEGKAIWTKELEVALAAGAVDAIVHCLKDVPTTLPKGLELAAVLEREDPRDVLVVKDGLPYQTLDELPPGSVVGTSSVRRVAQLRRRYPQLVYSDVRGNLNTRIAKLDSPTGPYTALVLAAAGLTRLNLSSRITAYLSSPVLLHSVGQGALTIEVRSPPLGASPLTNRDARIKEMIHSISDWRSSFRGSCERGLLHKLEGGCSIPVGVESWFEDHQLEEGRRNETGKGACPVMGPNKDGNENQIITINGEPKKTLGHTIPVKFRVGKSKEAAPTGAGGVNGSTAPSRPDTLERLATGMQDATTSTTTFTSSTGPRAIPDTHFTNGNQTFTNGYLVPSGPPSSVPTLTPTSPFAIDPLMAEIRSIPPSTGRILHLRAIVVSLDGRRSVSYASSKLCQTTTDAESLGFQVADVLLAGGGAVEIDGKEVDPDHQDAKGGAKSILEEVERHRALAEEADERRRREARANRAAQMAAKQAKGMLPPDHPEIDMNNFDLEVDKCVFAIDGTKQEIKESFRSKEVLDRIGRDDEQQLKQIDPLEVDRRGKERDDGQPKAWEV